MAILAEDSYPTRQTSIIKDSTIDTFSTQLRFIETCRLRYHTLTEIEELSHFLAQFFPNPRRVLLGISELLVNAVEHGTLGIGYETKTRLLEQGVWHEEVNNRLNLIENREKFIIVTVARQKDGTSLTIEDQGDGFDWKPYLQINAARAGDFHGRGIALARATCFDKLRYNKKGNKAIGFVSLAELMKG